jgi:hypothetical protein
MVRPCIPGSCLHLEQSGTGRRKPAIMFYMSEDNLTMELPELKERTWHLAVATACSISFDIIEPEQQQAIRENTIQVCSHSVVVCENR